MRKVPTNDERMIISRLKEKFDDEVIAKAIIEQYKEGLIPLDTFNCMLNLVGYTVSINPITKMITIKKKEYYYE